ncbi:hypothetical protein CMV_005884 [Castanea mollissima]|uniref:Uncharacterized protein n=1 Tax=Castanea mollissima TaxID=60419 RepID=A0A8J4RX86_9ROSI|nr:hypothetical protein CMV_005884 [Castanea mollissima]
MLKPSDILNGKSNGLSSNRPSSSNDPQSHQILCCAYNANGTVFVTGSSDFCKVPELDVLPGHENNVNYVQFSGCVFASKSSMADSLKENIPKFKNSWSVNIPSFFNLIFLSKFK